MYALVSCGKYIFITKIIIFREVKPSSTILQLKIDEKKDVSWLPKNIKKVELEDHEGFEEKIWNGLLISKEEVKPIPYLLKRFTQLQQ